MQKYIKRFFLFLLPIVRKAAVQVLADTLTKAAYPDEYRSLPRSRRYYSSLTHHYHPYAPRSIRYRTLSEARFARDNSRKGRRIESYRTRVRQRGTDRIATINPDERGPFHDVVLVAFDLQGPDAQTTHEWLHENLPAPGTGGANDEINLDSWWVANDERFDGSDTDSAVFVPKGKQEQVRARLDDWLFS